MIVHCQTCQADTILREGQATCSWCGTTPALSRPIPGRPGAALPHRIREPLGMSMRRVAIALLDRTDYPSILACQAGLFHQFYVRGWPTRSQKDASSLANRRRGPDETLAEYQRRTRAPRTRCSGTLTFGTRAGERCKRGVPAGATYCRFHDPDLADEVRDAILRARSSSKAFAQC
jgi:hypothetical protein